MLPQASAISESSSLSPSPGELLPRSVLAGLQILFHQMRSRILFGDNSRSSGASRGCGLQHGDLREGLGEMRKLESGRAEDKAVQSG